MKLPKLGLGTASAATITFGLVYGIRCDIYASTTGRGDPPACWLTAASLAGVGVGYDKGFNTINPDLRDPRAPKPSAPIKRAGIVPKRKQEDE